jgi:hypothetical protein
MFAGAGFQNRGSGVHITCDPLQTLESKNQLELGRSTLSDPRGFLCLISEQPIQKTKPVFELELSAAGLFSPQVLNVALPYGLLFYVTIMIIYLKQCRYIPLLSRFCALLHVAGVPNRNPLE